MANGLIQKKVNNKTLEEKVKETQEVSKYDVPISNKCI